MSYRYFQIAEEQWKHHSLLPVDDCYCTSGELVLPGRIPGPGLVGAHNGHNCSFEVEDPVEDHYILAEDHYNILEGDLVVDHSCTVELPEEVGSPVVDMFVFQNRGTLFMGLWK